MLRSVIASEDGRFGQPEIKLGVFPPVAAFRLPRQLGLRRAAEILLTGESLDAAEAVRVGLINRVVPAGQLEATAEEVVLTLRHLSAAALRACKRAMLLGDDGWGGLEAVERQYLDELMTTQDAQEGLAAFQEKRRPVWTDR